MATRNQIIPTTNSVAGLMKRKIIDSNTPGSERSIPNFGKIIVAQIMAQTEIAKNSNVGIN